METVTWHELNKLVRLALMGVGAAFAAAILSVLLGFGAAAAHADEDAEPGLLGAVTGLVADTTSAVGSTVTTVTSTATDAVATVVSVAPAPVAAVVETAGTAVAATVAPVQQAVSTEVVSTVATPVVELVTAVPVVGDVVSALGADEALTSVAADLDSTLTTVVGALTSAGEALATPVPPVAPVTDAAITVPLAVAPAHAEAFASALAPATDQASATSAHEGTSPGLAPSLPAIGATGVVAVTALLSAVDTHALHTSLGALCLSVISSGPGGAGLGVWALAALLPFVAHRAWVRRAGPEDQLVPAAPAGSTDVSPD